MSGQDTPLALPQQDGVEFRLVKDFPGYCVGNDGSVWSRWVSGCKARLADRWRRLPGNANPRGYWRVGLRRPEGGLALRLVHQLVLQAFVGPCPEGMEVCHRDGNPGNNLLSNLRWDTHDANIRDAVAHGVMAAGSRNASAKLTESDIPEIVRLVSEGATMRVVARLYGVHPAGISRIVNGHIWKGVNRINDG